MDGLCRHTHCTAIGSAGSARQCASVRARLCTGRRAAHRTFTAVASSRGQIQRTNVVATETTATPSWIKTIFPFKKKIAVEPLVPTVSAAELSALLQTLTSTTSETTAVVVVFSAVWCGPCKVMMQRLEGLSQKHRSSGVKIVKIDTEESEGGPELASQLGIHKLPTIIFCGPQEGKATIHLQGLVKETVLKDLVLNRCQYLGNDLERRMAW